MNSVVIGAVMALGMFQQTDTVIPVGDATLLDVEGTAGSITVDVWARDEVRIQAEHSRRTFIEIDHRGSRISVDAEARRGPANVVDYHITVPATMDLKLEGMMVSITVAGAMGDVEAETLQGDVSISGGRGTIRVSSMTGTILVDGAEGLIDVQAVADHVRVVNSSGEIVGESTGGDLIMENVRATSVDVGSVGGRIWYDGSFDPGGTYFFGSHGGDVTLVVPEGASAQFDLSSVYGSITDNLQGEMRSFEAGRRHTLETGGGGATVEVETFGGWIHIVRKGTEGDVPSRARTGMDMSGMDFGALTGLMDGVFDGVYSGLSHVLSDVHVDVDTDRDSRRHRIPGGGS